MRALMIAPLLLIASHQAAAQDASSDRATVRFSDPSRPGWVRANLVHGGITVKGYDGKEVVIEARLRTRTDQAQKTHTHFPNRSTGFTVEEKDNVLVIKTDPSHTVSDLIIQVPVRTSLQLRCVNDGDIVVEKVRGEMEAQNVNGSITLSDVAGSALANTVNGSVTAALAELDSAQAMSLVTLNGNVDVTLPPAAKASLKINVGPQGDVSSDFEIDTKDSAPAPAMAERGKGGRYVFKVDGSLVGTINGGGAPITLNTFNGQIVLRKSK